MGIFDQFGVSNFGGYQTPNMLQPANVMPTSLAQMPQVPGPMSIQQTMGPPLTSPQPMPVQGPQSVSPQSAMNSFANAPPQQVGSPFPVSAGRFGAQAPMTEAPDAAQPIGRFSGGFRG